MRIAPYDLGVTQRLREAAVKILSVSVTARICKGSVARFLWECYATHGSASTLLEALHSALRYLQEPIWQAPPLTDEKAERTTDEQQLIAMLKDLPLPITITSREGKYKYTHAMFSEMR
jgi:hypothetical protein